MAAPSGTVLAWASGETVVTATFTPEGTETGYRLDVYNEAGTLVYSRSTDTSAYSAGVVTIAIPSGSLSAGTYTANVFAVSAAGDVGAAAVAEFTI